MLPLHELEALVERYRRDRAWRQAAPRAAEVRDQLGRGRWMLARAAEAVGAYTRHELALVGATADEARGLHDLLGSWSAKSGVGVEQVNAMGLNGRKRLVDYREPPARFTLLCELADRLAAAGIPPGGQEAGAL